MANTYYDATGVLVLNKVTPVITALFGCRPGGDSIPLYHRNPSCFQVKETRS